MEAYLDNSATTRCREEVSQLVRETMLVDFGNPSSMHHKGVEAEQYMKKALKQIASTLKVPEREIYFTSGGTESDNWALIGSALANQRKGKHLIITAVEHPAVSSAAEFLEKQGFEISRLPVNKEGCVSLESLKKEIREDTILVSTMYVNNEIGSVQPVEEIGSWLKKEHPQVIYHVDAIQAYGKYRIHPSRMGIDLLAVSGHKIHGPKGIGFLYINSKIKISPIIFGGGQQNNMRSGTDNVAGAAGLGLAAEFIYRDLETKVDHMRKLKLRLAEGISAMEDTVLHGMDPAMGAPHILNASFLGVRSEVLLHSLEDRGIYVSAGSACSTHKKSKSPTLEAISAGKDEKESAVRFSLCENTTEEEIDYTLDVIKELLPMLRRYRRS